VAALAMAPPAVSAAPPNKLSSPTASPVSGEPVNTFALSVHYASATGDPATSATATLANLSVPLVLAAGSAIDGTWRAVASLPPGSWIVTFEATTLGGAPPATVSCGVMVDGAPSTGSSGSPSNSLTDPGAGSTPSSNPAPQATPTPQPSAAPAAHDVATVRLVSSESGTGPSSDRPAVRDRPRPRPNRTSTADPSRTPEPAPSSSGAGGTGSPPADTDDTIPGGLWLVLLWGAAAVGALALVGTTWLLVANRRQPEPLADSLDGAESDLAIRAIPTVEQRARRRARLRQEDDPIVAGLGLEDEATRAATPRSRRGGRPRP
jgi:hypothetical protein